MSTHVEVPSHSKKRKSIDGDLPDHSTKRVRTEVTAASSISVSAEQQKQPSRRSAELKEHGGKREKRRGRGGRKRRNAVDEDADGEESVSRDQEGAEVAKNGSTKQSGGSKKRKQSKSSTPIEPCGSRDWTLTSSSGGRFLAQDPVFIKSSQGEDHLVAAMGREIQILALDTSLVAFSHLAPDTQTITSYAVDSQNETRIHIGYHDGSIETWNWESDESFMSHSRVSEKSIESLCSASTSEVQPQIFFVAHSKTSSTIYTGTHKLHKAGHKISSLQVIGSAEYIIASGHSAITLGHRTGREVLKANFTWIELRLTTQPSCVDARIIPSTNPKFKSPSGPPKLSLAIGGQSGQIHLYADVSTLFNSKDRIQLPSPQILHWHRNAVSSVKFSRDGVYLISGGTETVLVLWQLNTGKKQFLPHLTSAIVRIVVNPLGDRYALRMGDNSIMVLSTSELKPVANFAGLQLSPTNINTVDNQIIQHPKKSNQILLTVPPTNPEAFNKIEDRPFLQTFDVSTCRHVSRQALTRNNVTDFNEGPENTPIRSPDVAHIAVSSDGQWLASVDEWMPPASDLAHLVTDGIGLEEEQQKRREVYLKFWRWDDEQSLWNLTTRADSPHSRPQKGTLGAGKILVLSANPEGKSFATVGEDNTVRIWRPKTRMRHGVALTDDQNRVQVEWRCKRTIILPAERDDSPMEILSSRSPCRGCLAFSNDGSVLAVSLAGSTWSQPIVYFIDTASGEIAYSNASLADDEIVALGFIERHLVVVTRSAIFSWDTITTTCQYKTTNDFTRQGGVYTPYLALNLDDGTFAVSTTMGKSGSQIEVYASKDSQCLFKCPFSIDVQALLAGVGSRGFRVLFADGTLRTLSPVKSRFLELPEAETVVEPASEAIATEAESNMTDLDMVDPSESKTRPWERDVGDDRPVVRPEELANIFDVGPSFAMPPVKDMFQAVMKLFGRKPIVSMQRSDVEMAA